MHAFGARLSRLSKQTTQGGKGRNVAGGRRKKHAVLLVSVLTADFLL